MSKFKVNRGNLQTIIQAFRPNLTEFENILDSTQLYSPLKAFELENETTVSQIKVVETKIKSVETNVIKKDGGEYYTTDAASKLNEEVSKILKQEVEFDLNSISKDDVSKFPKTMSEGIYILWDKLFI